MELTNDFRVSAPPPKAWEVLTDVERIAPMLPGAQLQEIEGDDFRGVVKVKVGPITAQYKGTASFAERNEADGRVVLKATGRDTRGQGNASATITATLVPDGAGTRVTVVTDLTVTGKVAQFGRGVLADVSAKLIGQFVDALEADLQNDGAPVESTVASAAAAPPERARPWRAAVTPVPGSAAPPTPTDVTDSAVQVEAADVTDHAAVSPAPTSAAAVSEAVAAASEEGRASQPAAPAAPAAPVAHAEAVIPDNAPGAEAAAGEPDSTTPPVAEKPRIRHIDSPEPEPVDLLGAAGGSVAKRLVPILGGIGILILSLLIGRSRRKR